jgi:hypothetical protein
MTWLDRSARIRLAGADDRRIFQRLTLEQPIGNDLLRAGVAALEAPSAASRHRREPVVVGPPALQRLRLRHHVP